MKKMIEISFFLASIFLFVDNLLAYDGSVHSKINEESVNFSQLDSVLKGHLGISNGKEIPLTKGKKTQQAWKWLAYGGEAEDFGWLRKYHISTTRAFNHFHDPLKTWDEADLDDPYSLIYTGNYLRNPVSPILWGFNPGQQDFAMNFTGDWSWGKAREYFYTYLTGKDFAGITVAVTQEEREVAFADCFRAVGQVMHLLEDMSVPLHTRNDVHVFPLFDIVGRWTYETYAKKNINNLDYNPDQLGDRPHLDLLTDPQPDPGYTDLVPVTGLFDRNLYNIGSAMPASDARIGMAEYSNANFLTNDTMFTYQHPSLSETNYDAADWLNAKLVVAKDGVGDNRIYFRKTTGEPIEHFMAAGYWYYQLFMWNKLELYYAFIVDEVCFADYADKLIPRAVGYSAALLDYFFRGTMDIQAATLQRDNSGRIRGLDFEVKNTTLLAGSPDIEPFENGSLSLSYQYTPPGQTEPQYGLLEGSIYPITGADDLINSDYVSLSVPFAEDSYIPAGATDISFTIVFRGKLGYEENAVVGKVFSMTASRIAYLYRPGGEPNPSHIYTVFPDGTDKRQITNATLGENWFFSPVWGPDARMLAFENETGTCPGTNCIAYPREIDVIDMTSELPYPDNVIRRLKIYDTRIDDEGNPYSIVALFHPSFSPDGSQIIAWAQGLNVNYIYPLVIFDVDTDEWQYINGYEYWEQKSAPGENRSSIAWSPLGDKIAYTVIEEHDTFSDMDIYTIKPDGTEDVRILDDDFISGDPSWSPDGEQIVFISDRDGIDEYYDIWIMDKDGQNPTKIYSCIPHCAGPSFSPDGSRIVFSYGETVHSVNVDGTELELIETTASNPSWSSFFYSPSQ